MPTQVSESIEEEEKEGGGRRKERLTLRRPRRPRLFFR